MTRKDTDSAATQPFGREMTLADRVRWAVETAAGWDRAEASERLGISRTTLWRWFTEGPPPDGLRKVAEATGTSLLWLLHGIGSPADSPPANLGERVEVYRDLWTSFRERTKVHSPIAIRLSPYMGDPIAVAWLDTVVEGWQAEGWEKSEIQAAVRQVAAAFSGAVVIHRMRPATDEWVHANPDEYLSPEEQREVLRDQLRHIEFFMAPAPPGQDDRANWRFRGREKVEFFRLGVDGFHPVTSVSVTNEPIPRLICDCATFRLSGDCPGVRAYRAKLEANQVQGGS